MHDSLNDIADLLKRYADGLYRCDTALLGTVFHPQARYATASDGALLHLDMATYLAIVEARVSPESRGGPFEFVIESIDLAGPVTALARLRGVMLGRRYIDLLTLIRVDGAWRIIAKVFHVESAEPART